eukprot:954275-Prymnesium_polylepis.1
MKIRNGGIGPLNEWGQSPDRGFMLVGMIADDRLEKPEGVTELLEEPIYTDLPMQFEESTPEVGTRQRQVVSTRRSGATCSREEPEAEQRQAEGTKKGATGNEGVDPPRCEKRIEGEAAASQHAGDTAPGNVGAPQATTGDRGESATGSVQGNSERTQGGVRQHEITANET